MSCLEENLTRMLEKLDCLYFNEHDREGRAKRKGTVDRIQVNIIIISLGLKGAGLTILL